MQENVPLTIERLSDAQEQEFRVASALEIRAILRDIADKGLLAALYYDGTKNFVMTSVLQVGNKGLWVEQGVDAQHNRLLAESGRITFVCSLNQVKIQFVVAGARAVEYQGYQAFYLPLPANLYRLQHREYYRLALPVSERLLCNMPVGKSSAENRKEAMARKDVPVMDISVGGLRLFCADEDIDFVLGQLYGGCRIGLPEIGVIDVTLVVKNLVSTSPKSGQVIRRVGCEFRDIDTASSILLQRFVTKVQRSRAAA